MGFASQLAALASPRSRVTGATVNGTGSLIMRAEKVGAETVLAQIVKMVSEAQAESMEAKGQTVMFVAVGGKPVGLLCVADPIKETTPEALRQLHAEGIRIVMMTGDNRVKSDDCRSRHELQFRFGGGKCAPPAQN